MRSDKSWIAVISNNYLEKAWEREDSAIPGGKGVCFVFSPNLIMFKNQKTRQNIDRKWITHSITLRRTEMLSNPKHRKQTGLV